MSLFKRVRVEDKVEERFQTAVNLVKDLDKREFNRLIEGLELAWKSYYKIRGVQTIEEKESSDITNAEKILELEDKK